MKVTRNRPSPMARLACQVSDFPHHVDPEHLVEHETTLLATGSALESRLHRLGLSVEERLARRVTINLVGTPLFEALEGALSPKHHLGFGTGTRELHEGFVRVRAHLCFVV